MFARTTEVTMLATITCTQIILCHGAQESVPVPVQDEEKRAPSKDGGSSSALNWAELIPNIETDTQLGSGGSGTVFKKETSTGKFAIKIYDVNENPKTRIEDFKKETQSLRDFQTATEDQAPCPYIARLQGMCQHDGRCYSAWDLCEHGDMRQVFYQGAYHAGDIDHDAHVLRKSKDGSNNRYCPFTLNRKTNEALIFYYLQQLLEGVKILNDAGFSHTDIKEENIVMCDDFRLKIIDFDHMKMSRTEKMTVPFKTVARLVANGDYTHIYRLAPELIRRSGQRRSKVGLDYLDWWSLGQTLLTMVTRGETCSFGKFSDLAKGIHLLKTDSQELFDQIHRIIDNSVKSEQLREVLKLLLAPTGEAYRPLGDKPKLYDPEDEYSSCSSSSRRRRRLLNLKAPGYSLQNLNWYRRDENTYEKIKAFLTSETFMITDKENNYYKEASKKCYWFAEIKPLKEMVGVKSCYLDITEEHCEMMEKIVAAGKSLGVAKQQPTEKPLSS